MFLYEREHLDDAPALVLDLLSTVHETDLWKVEEIHHWKLSEEEEGKKSPPLTGKIMVFVELGWGGNSPKALGISLIRGFSWNKSAGMESQPPLNECTVI